MPYQPHLQSRRVSNSGVSTLFWSSLRAPSGFEVSRDCHFSFALSQASVTFYADLSSAQKEIDPIHNRASSSIHATRFPATTSGFAPLGEERPMATKHTHGLDPPVGGFLFSFDSKCVWNYATGQHIGGPFQQNIRTPQQSDSQRPSCFPPGLLLQHPPAPPPVCLPPQPSRRAHFQHQPRQQYRHSLVGARTKYAFPRRTLWLPRRWGVLTCTTYAVRSSLIPVPLGKAVSQRGSVGGKRQQLRHCAYDNEQRTQ